ncbi:MAG TPA: cyclase [Methanobacterium sp.]|nr:cyclase [Methanobacterium sp.]
MTFVLAIHKVKDYNKWKSEYDEQGTLKTSNGSKEEFVFRNTNNPNEMVVLTPCKNLQSAKTYAEAENLNFTSQKDGVTDQPKVYYLEVIMDRIK